MKTSDSITLTNSRQYNVLKVLVNRIVDERKIEEKVNQTIDASKIRTGILTKFYPYLDKFEVKLDNVSKTVLCEKLHLFGGSLIDFYTPEGETVFCENLREPCIVPREELHVCVADISNKDKKEMLMLGYFFPNEIVGIKPADPGYLKLMDIGATNLWGISIGRGEVKVNTCDGVTQITGEFHEDNTVVEYADSKEVYTKKEVDALIKKAIEDVKKEILEVDANAAEG